jgi:hypothetical protein
MKTIDETKSIRQIEEKLASGMIEEVIYQAHNELKLIRLMKSWKPWEYLYSEIDEKESLLNMLNIRNDNPFPTINETFDNMRHNKPERRPSAAVHPEDAK